MIYLVIRNTNMDKTLLMRSFSNVTPVTGDVELLVILKYINAFTLERNHSNVLFVIKDFILPVK